MSKPNRLLELQTAWYQRLKEEGFQDIEDPSLPERPLKEWHSLLFLNEPIRIRRALHEEWEEKAQAFFNRPDLEDIWEWMASQHGNNTVTASQVKLIWELKMEGLSQRKIALKLGRSKTCIHLILERIRSWMMIV